jgi:hypothetical protein
MKTKAIIGFLVVLVVIAATLVLTMRPEEPIQVFGDLSKREVADICIAVRHKIHPVILPDLSVQSLRGAPGRILQRFGRSNPEIWKLEARTYGFVAVIGRSPHDEPPRPRVFWGVFRGTNAWSVENEFHY